MTHNNQITNSDNDFSTPPLNTVEGYRNQKANVKDEHMPVVITHSGFHGSECVILMSTRMTREAELWETYAPIVLPCRACWTTAFVANWQEQVRLRHHDCCPRSSLFRPPGFCTEGKNTLPPEALRRVLNREREGITPQMIARELKGVGIETTITAVEHAVNRKPPYDGSIYDRLYDAYAGS